MFDDAVTCRDPLVLGRRIPAWIVVGHAHSASSGCPARTTECLPSPHVR